MDSNPSQKSFIWRSGMTSPVRQLIRSFRRRPNVFLKASGFHSSLLICLLTQDTSTGCKCNHRLSESETKEDTVPAPIHHSVHGNTTLMKSTSLTAFSSSYNADEAFNLYYKWSWIDHWTMVNPTISERFWILCALCLQSKGFWSSSYNSSLNECTSLTTVSKTNHCRTEVACGCNSSHISSKFKNWPVHASTALGRFWCCPCVLGRGVAAACHHTARSVEHQGRAQMSPSGCER